jgi:hypothetical protein
MNSIHLLLCGDKLIFIISWIILILIIVTIFCVYDTNQYRSNWHLINQWNKDHGFHHLPDPWG